MQKKHKIEVSIVKFKCFNYIEKCWPFCRVYKTDKLYEKVTTVPHIQFLIITIVCTMNKRWYMKCHKK